MQLRPCAYSCDALMVHAASMQLLMQPIAVARWSLLAAPQLWYKKPP
jgi:hypothetical protein